MKKNMKMQAVILAAGKGTRMRPLTYEIPKSMLLVKGKPILEYTLNFLPESVDEVVIVINYLGEHIKNKFGSKYKNKKIKYVFQEELNGTGGALFSAKGFLREKFLVLMGDDLYHKNDILKLSLENLAILACELKDPTHFGVLKTNHRGELIEIIEKPRTKKYKLVNTGAYLINQNIFDCNLVPISEKEFGLPQTLIKMAKNEKIKVLKASHWHPVGFPEDLKKAEKILHNFC